MRYSENHYVVLENPARFVSIWNGIALDEKTGLEGLVTGMKNIMKVSEFIKSNENTNQIGFVAGARDTAMQLVILIDAITKFFFVATDGRVTIDHTGYTVTSPNTSKAKTDLCRMRCIVSYYKLLLDPFVAFDRALDTLKTMDGFVKEYKAPKVIITGEDVLYRTNDLSDTAIKELTRLHDEIKKNINYMEEVLRIFCCNSLGRRDGFGFVLYDYDEVDELPQYINDLVSNKRKRDEITEEEVKKQKTNEL